MPLPFSLAFASATASISVTAYIPPRCDFELSRDSLVAWCNAECWSVIERDRDGTETAIWRGDGVGIVTLPASSVSTYRLDVNY